MCKWGLDEEVYCKEDCLIEIVVSVVRNVVMVYIFVDVVKREVLIICVVLKVRFVFDVDGFE